MSRRRVELTEADKESLAYWGVLVENPTSENLTTAPVPVTTSANLQTLSELTLTSEDTSSIAEESNTTTTTTTAKENIFPVTSIKDALIIVSDKTILQDNENFIAFLHINAIKNIYLFEKNITDEEQPSLAAFLAAHNIILHTYSYTSTDIKARYQTLIETAEKEISKQTSFCSSADNKNVVMQKKTIDSVVLVGHASQTNKIVFLHADTNQPGTLLTMLPPHGTAESSLSQFVVRLNSHNITTLKAEEIYGAMFTQAVMTLDFKKVQSLLMETGNPNLKPMFTKITDPKAKDRAERHYPSLLHVLNKKLQDVPKERPVIEQIMKEFLHWGAYAFIPNQRGRLYQEKATDFAKNLIKQTNEVKAIIFQALQHTSKGKYELIANLMKAYYKPDTDRSHSQDKLAKEIERIALGKNNKEDAYKDVELLTKIQEINNSGLKPYGAFKGLLEYICDPKKLSILLEHINSPLSPEDPKFILMYELEPCDKIGNFSRLDKLDKKSKFVDKDSPLLNTNSLANPWEDEALKTEEAYLKSLTPNLSSGL